MSLCCLTHEFTANLFFKEGRQIVGVEGLQQLLQQVVVAVPIQPHHVVHILDARLKRPVAALRSLRQVLAHTPFRVIHLALSQVHADHGLKCYCEVLTLDKCRSYEFSDK
jgi:hypothetical protein